MSNELKCSQCGSTRIREFWWNNMRRICTDCRHDWLLPDQLEPELNRLRFERLSNGKTDLAELYRQGEKIATQHAAEFQRWRDSQP